MRLILASASPRRLEILRSLGLDPEVRPAHVDESVPPRAIPIDLVQSLARRKAESVDEGLEPTQGERLVIGADTLVVIADRILGKPADPADAMRMLGELAGRAHHVLTGLCLIHRPGALLKAGTRTPSIHETGTAVAPMDPRNPARPNGPVGTSRHIYAAKEPAVPAPGTHGSVGGVSHPGSGSSPRLRGLIDVASTVVHFAPLTESQIRDYISTGEPLDKAGAYGIQGGAGRFVERLEGSYTNVVGFPVELFGDLLARLGLTIDDLRSPPA